MTDSTLRRHAYLILAHKNFGQLRKLLALLDDLRNDIFVHVDRKAAFDQSAWDDACRYSGLVFIEPRIRVSWGGVSIMRCELALLKFEKHDGCEFLNYWHFKKTTRSRFQYYTLFPEGAGQFWPNLANNIFKGLQMAVGYRINREIDFRFASQWFSITDSLARYVLSKEDWLEKVFRHTNTCDEIFMATLVWNSPFRERLFVKEAVEEHTVNLSNMRFIDWSRGESVRHPWTFRTGDMELLMNVPHLWARKFDETVDSGIIDMIFNHLKINTV